MSIEHSSHPNPEAEVIKAAYAKLTPEQSVLQDKLLEFSAVKQDDAQHLKSLNTLDSKQAHSFLQLLDKDQKIWKGVDYAKAKAEFGLECNLIPGSEAAERLLLEVIDRKIDITTDEGKKDFVDQWKKNASNLPMPCVPPNNFWYLEQLSQTPTRIIANREKRKTNQPAIPHFAEDEILLVDSWQEQNWDSEDALKDHKSELVKALLPPEAGRRPGSTVNIKRQDIDKALWDGDPADRIPTEKHQEILQQLGCDPKEFELRLIRQDEYARLASYKAWGQKNLWTNFDNYYLEDDGARHGLFGGRRGLGGASHVRDYWRVYAYDDLAVRLVLSRKQK